MTLSTLQQRVITGAMLCAIVLVVGLAAATSCETRWWVVSFCFIICAFCAWEFSVFAGKARCDVTRSVVYFFIIFAPHLSLLLALAARDSCDDFVARNYGFIVLSGACVMAFVGALVYLAWAGRNSLSAASEIAQELFLALFLIGFGGGSLMCLGILPYAHRILAWLLLVVCLNDIAAYAVGKRIGGKKLAVALSPNKTLSGSVAGIIAGIAAGVMGAFLLQVSLDAINTLAVSFSVVLAAQTADLGKSFLKRIHGVKDSGTLLPGHGGVLDRVDGLLGASPVLYVWLSLLG